MPEKEKFHVTKLELLAQMDSMMGGRAAEELTFGTEKITSGASSDLKVSLFSSISWKILCLTLWYSSNGAFTLHRRTFNTSIT